MAKRRHIRAVSPDAAQNAQDKTVSNEIPEGDTSDTFIDENVSDEPLEADEFDLADYIEEEPYEVSSDRFGWIAPSVACALILGWTALYLWAMQDRLLAANTAPPSEWVRWIIDWSVPVLLVGVGWLLTMRHSRAEAKRFAQTAALLSQESAELETRLTVVNRELSLAREFLGAQSRELESLGRIASEKLSTHAEELQGLIVENGEQVEAIGSASEAALGNMKRLRDDLPVVANSARDVSNQVGNAGNNAQEQLDKLVGGFERLNEFGKASERQVTALDDKVSKSLGGLETQLTNISDTITTRLDAVEERAGSYRSEVDAAEGKALAALGERMTMLQTEAKAISGKLREGESGAIEQFQSSKKRFEEDVIKTMDRLDKLDAHAITASQNRIKELQGLMDQVDEHISARERKSTEETTRRQEEFDTREAQASEVLAQRLAELDDNLAERRQSQLLETEKLVEQSSSLTEQLDKLSALINDVSEQSDTTREGLTTGLEQFSEQVAEKRSELGETEAQLKELTEAGIRLLEIIQSGAKHSREDLPEAIEVASKSLSGVEERATLVSGLMLSTDEKASKIGDYLIETQEKIAATDTSIDTLQDKLIEHSEEALSKLQGLRGGFTRLAKDSENYASDTQGNLRDALTALEDATTSAFAALDEGAREKVHALAGTISADAVTEIERALRNDTAETVGKLEQAASHAAGVGREATSQLRDQLAKVNELTKNLEQRIARSRELAEEKVGNDFARRMALITDSLNSSAIDITGALSTEVTDTAWDAYLKGDRGIFTRRAVRLIDSGEAKEIGELYQSDEDFKANVSRYIHDFEAMLRSMLSTRDGNALGVTLLGSDMGKLYVVLAQAIERFRN